MFGHLEKCQKLLDNKLLTSYNKVTDKEKSLKPLHHAKGGDCMIKGYLVPNGYMGYISATNTYQLFATEQEYLEYIA